MLRRLSFYILLISLGNCTSTHQLATTVTPLDQALMQLPSQPGMYNLSVPAARDGSMNFSVQLPDTSLAKRFPLVIGLHWAGGGDVYQEFSNCLIAPAFADYPMIGIYPDAEFQTRTTPGNERKVMSLIEAAKRQLPVDPERIIVVGYSNGGNGSWYFAERYPNEIFAALPMASSYRPQQKIEVPLYVIHGAEDELFPLNRTQGYVKTAQDQGTSVVFNVADNYSHYMACQYVDQLKEGVAWLRTLE